MKKILSKPQWFLLVAAAIVLVTIFVTPLGVSESGNRTGLLQRVGLVPDVSQTGIVQMEYMTVEKGAMPASGFELVLHLVKAISSPFSLKILFVIYSILFLLGLYLVVRNISQENIFMSILCIVVPLFIFCDYAYTCYFMSVYEHPFIYATLMLLVGLLLDAHRRDGIDWLYGVLIALCGVAFATVNFITALVAIVIGVAVIFYYQLGKKAPAFICGGLIIISALSLMLFGSPVDRERNLYNSVFYGVCNYDSVTELGINGDLDQLKGVPYSAQVVDEHNLEERFYSDISYSDIIGYYATHPKAFADALTVTLAGSANVQDSNMGNYMDSALKKANGFSLYSWGKSLLLGTTASALLTWLFLYYAALFVVYRKADKKRRVLLNLFILPGITGGLALLYPYIFSGTTGLGSNLFLFNLSFDFMVFVSIVGGVWEMARRKKYIREKFGVTQ